jgi:hypothetical protein
MYKKFSIIIISFFVQTALAVVPGGLAAIEAILNNYKRPITILEIGANNAPYAYSLSKHYKGTCVAMMQENATALVDKIVTKARPNLVVLNPQFITHTLLNRFGQCEHIDVVIVHDIVLLGDKNITTLLQPILRLGNHIFVELPQSYVEQLPEEMQKPQIIARLNEELLCYFCMERTDLRLPRWDANFDEKRAYKIQSNFQKKKLYKPLLDTTVEWIPGINLITFVMTRGIYPTDKMIRKSLNSFKNIKHNDLVLGNIVVQGAQIVPIDFGDKRRNANLKLHIKAALKVFSFRRRFANARGAMDMYRKYLSDHR